MKNELFCLSTLLGATGRSRWRTLRATIVILPLIALPLARASENIPPEKAAVGRAGGSLPPAEQRVFDKSAAPAPMSLGTQKKVVGPVVSGVLPPGEVKADKKSGASPAAVSVRSIANPALGPVSGQASPEELRGYQKPGGSSGAVSVLMLPLTAPAPGAEKVAVGTVTGPASPEELRGYVKPAVLPGAAPEPTRAPTSGTVPLAEQRHFQK
jgi:hypothetical protein